MKLYRFSPIRSEEELRAAIEHIHRACYALCKQTFGTYLPNAGNVGVFCHYEDEFVFLTKLREELTEPSGAFNQKYYRLKTPIVVSAEGDVPEATYTHLYIRRTDPYRHHVGDLDFFVELSEYVELKEKAARGELPGARVFSRPDLDMIELYDPDVDALAYVSTHKMTQKAHVKQTESD